MNTVIAALDKIYEDFLVRDGYSQDILQGFKENLNRIKAEWDRRSLVRELVESIRRDGYEAFGQRIQEVNREINIQYANGNHNCSARGEFQLMLEADAIWIKEGKQRIAKEAEEVRLREEPLRLQKLREEELLAEARRRLAEERREEAIRALMDSLRGKET